MQKIDITGLSPNQIEYVSSLEKTVENQQIRIEQLTELLIKSQKALYGQSSEKRGSVANNTWTGMIFVIDEMTFISLIFYAIPKSWLINITSSVIFDVPACPLCIM